MTRNFTTRTQARSRPRREPSPRPNPPDAGCVPELGLQVRLQELSARVYAGSLEFAADTSLFLDYFVSVSKNP